MLFAAGLCSQYAEGFSGRIILIEIAAQVILACVTVRSLGLCPYSICHRLRDSVFVSLGLRPLDSGG
ncbi:hypothetical protein HY78_31015 (plasmid) [Rhizorhabdus wittichii DC-6]|nr:hypothetical protein HY78_31015 [Rhizorhabdus wittichii DC-6]